MIPHEAGYPDPSRPASPVAGRITPIPPSQGPIPPGLNAAPDITALLGALRRRWIACVLLGGTLAVIAAVSVYLLLAPYATAYSRIRVAFIQPTYTRPNGPNDFKTVLKTTSEELKSRTVINAVLKREEVKRLGLDRSPTESAQAIEEGLKVDFADSSEVVQINFTHHDPALALVIANAVKEAYFDTFVDPRRAARGSRVTELEKRYNEAAESLNRKKANLIASAKDAGDLDPKIYRQRRAEILLTLSYVRQRLDQVVLERVKAEDSLGLTDARIKAMADRKEPVAGGQEAPDIEAQIEQAMGTDAEAKRLNAKLIRAEELADEYGRKGFPESYYPYRSAISSQKHFKQKIAERRVEVAAKVKATAGRMPVIGPAGAPREDPAIMRDHLAKHVVNLKKIEASLEQRHAKLVEDVGKAPNRTEEMERAEAEIAKGELTVASLFAKVDQEKLEMLAAPRITRLQDAEMKKTDTKKQLMATLAAPVAVLFATCFGLAWLECSQQRVRGAREISRGLGIRVVGAVPRQAGLTRQVVGSGGECELEGTPVMESIDAIRARLLHEADTRSTRVVMVTSARMGEGKTTLAAALATSLARAGRKTLLLDGDLRRPTVHELFEIPAQPGFSEVLIGEVELLEAIQDTHMESLSVMPAGQWDREVLGALARGGLEPIFEKLAEEFDFILIDSHPVLEATDALLIGGHADAVLLSVLSEVSQMPRVYAAQQQLASVGIRILGAVVNAACPEDALTSPQVPVAG